MSIRPQFVERILSGAKKVEFRKRPLAEDIDRVLIYTTSPVKMVVGEFHIAEQIMGDPNDLWHQFEDVAGIDGGAFFEYFEGVTRAVAIRIKTVKEYSAHLSLTDVDPGGRPPQSFKYLTMPALV